jgi:hypothetical protein
MSCLCRENRYLDKHEKQIYRSDQKRLRLVDWLDRRNPRREQPGQNESRVVEKSPFRPGGSVLLMPTILINGYKFRFYSSDVNEPPHVHVINAERVAKIWLESLEIEYNRGYNKAELNKVLKLTEQNESKLLEAWHEHFDR